MHGRCVLALSLVATTLTSSCMFINIPPDRTPADLFWNERMLAGEYGRWNDDGSRSVSSSRDEISDWPNGALSTKWGIETSARRLEAGWSMIGGLIGRRDVPGGTVELFAKEISRAHAPGLGVVRGRDFSYEFFLLIRPVEGRARVVRRWFFPPEALAMVLPPSEVRRLRSEGRSEAEIQAITEKTPVWQRMELIRGRLRFEPQTQTATVRIENLKQPVEEQVDLTKELAELSRR
jgi:hypothetical protein